MNMLLLVAIYGEFKTPSGILEQMLNFFLELATREMLQTS
jgi:hypothetical protein